MRNKLDCVGWADISSIDYGKLKKSLMQLEARYKEWLECSSRPELRDSDREAIKESCVQRFKSCYNTIRGHLRKHLIEIGVSKVPYSSKDLFRMGADNGLIEDTEDWFSYTDITYDYDDAKVNEILMIIPNFIDDAIDLYEAMTEEEWND